MRKLLCLLALLCLFPSAILAAPRNIEVPAAGGGVFLRAPTYIDHRVLSAGTAEYQTVPSGASFVVFSADCPFYANYTTAAAIPSSDVTDGTGSDFNPTQRYLGTGISAISVISSSSCVVTFLFYKS